MKPNEFLQQFNFQPRFHRHVSVERERFLVDHEGRLQPDAHRFLAKTQQLNGTADRWCGELSGCQIEDRPLWPWQSRHQIASSLLQVDLEGHMIAKTLNRQLTSIEAAPRDMPLDPCWSDAHYIALSRNLPPDIYLAACRVAGTHLHLGCRHAHEAIDVCNALLPHIDQLCKLGDHTHGLRRRLFNQVVPDLYPPHFDSVEHLQHWLSKSDGSADPSSSQRFTRVSKHGTVELRMFGITPNHEEIISWIEVVFDLLGWPLP